MTDCMVSISQMGRQGSKTAMAVVEVQMEAATSRTNLTRIFFTEIFQEYFSRIFFRGVRAYRVGTGHLLVSF